MNMNKEYRKELKALTRQRKFHTTQAAKIARDTDVQKRKLDRSMNRLLKANTKMANRVDRRIAILEGRMS